MKEDLRRRVRKLCTEAILRKVLTKNEPAEPASCNLKRYQQLDPRTIRNIRANLSMNPPLSFIDNNADAIVRHSDKLSESWSYRLQDKSSRTTPLDKIVHSLKSDVWPRDILLLITPAPGPPGHYKLYLLDRSRNGQFVGSTNITGDILAELKSSKAYQQYCIVLGTNYIELSTSDQKTAFIRNLLQTMNGEDGHNRCDNNLIKAHSTSNICRELSCTCNEEEIVPYSIEAELENLEKIQSIPRPNDINLMELMERINNTFLPAEVDLHRFFDLAEFHEFKLFIRPELYWKNCCEVDPETMPNLARFSIECFMLFNNYVGGISMDGEQLQQKLHEHPRLLQKVKVITDVCEITPLPKPLCKCMRTLCGWLRMEILYDAFGEFVFDLYKHYVHC